jgi:hypothetical protein
MEARAELASAPCHGGQARARLMCYLGHWDRVAEIARAWCYGFRLDLRVRVVADTENNDMQETREYYDSLG